MPTEIDDIFSEEVPALLSEFGKDIVLITVVEGAYNYATGKASNTQSETTVKGFVEDYDLNAIDKARGLIIRSDRKVTIGAQGGISPKATDKLRFDGVTYSIEDREPIYSGELVAIWILQARAI